VSSALQISFNIKNPTAVIRAQLHKGISIYSSVPKAVIRDDLKAGGTIQREFSVKMTSEGVKIDLTV